MKLTLKKLFLLTLASYTLLLLGIVWYYEHQISTLQTMTQPRLPTIRQFQSPSISDIRPPQQSPRPQRPSWFEELDQFFTTRPQADIFDHNIPDGGRGTQSQNFSQTIITPEGTFSYSINFEPPIIQGTVTPSNDTQRQNIIKGLQELGLTLADNNNTLIFSGEINNINEIIGLFRQ